jgi:hypothetical protein
MVVPSASCNSHATGSPRSVAPSGIRLVAGTGSTGLTHSPRIRASILAERQRCSSREWEMFGRATMLAISAGLLLTACNPIATDPVSQGGELEETIVRYTGPPAAWIETATTGADAFDIFLLASIRNEDLQGPATRNCIDTAGRVTECTKSQFFVQTPNQRTIPTSDPRRRVRLITVWENEPVSLILVCIDPATQELGCPNQLRTRIRAVDDAGALIGDLALASTS